MSNIDKLAKELKALTDESNDRKPKAYSTTAEVVRVEDDILWVHIPGGIEETPVRKTINANKGDVVKVNIENGGAWAVGNASAPPTDDRRANEAYTVGMEASAIAESAIKDATRAKEAADIATTEADKAQDAATKATTIVESVETMTNIAITNLEVIENIIGVLEMVQKHGRYILTKDEEVIDEKRYFLRSGEDPDYIYSIVYNPTGNPKEQDYYELYGVDETIQNYISSHLILTNNGLELKSDTSKYRMLLTSEAMNIIAPDGTIVGSHGETIILGNAQEIHFEATPTKIKFSTPNEDLCWFGSNSDGIWEMHVETTYVEKMVRYGDYAFIKRTNGNMSLKWLGD